MAGPCLTDMPDTLLCLTDMSDTLLCLTDMPDTTLSDMLNKLGYYYKRMFLNEGGIIFIQKSLHTIIYTTAHNTI